MAGYRYRAIRLTPQAKWAIALWNERQVRARQAYDRHPDSTHRQATRHPEPRRKTT